MLLQKRLSKCRSHPASLNQTEQAYRATHYVTDGPLLIDIIAGARPNFMKIAPIIRALDSRRAAGGPLRYRLVHTGQHYDARMSGDFFTQLGIPAPDVNLEVGSGTQAEQTAAIMVRYEKGVGYVDARDGYVRVMVRGRLEEAETIATALMAEFAELDRTLHIAMERGGKL